MDLVYLSIVIAFFGLMAVIVVRPTARGDA